MPASAGAMWASSVASMCAWIQSWLSAILPNSFKSTVFPTPRNPVSTTLLEPTTGGPLHGNRHCVDL
jgi:hypothetical protein